MKKKLLALFASLTAAFALAPAALADVIPMTPPPQTESSQSNALPVWLLIVAVVIIVAAIVVISVVRKRAKQK